MDTKKLSKMSIKGMGCRPVASETATPLCVIFGRAESIKVNEDRAGRALSVIVGSFEAVNLNTGARYRSYKLYLPSGIHEAMQKQVEGLAGDNALQFAVRISSIKGSSALGYVYQAARLFPFAECDVLDALRGAVNALLAPAAAEPAAAEPAPAEIAAKPDKKGKHDAK